MTTFDIVVPTVGRPTLGRLLHSLATQDQLAASSVIIVDDRPGGDRLQLPPLDLPCPLVIKHGGGRGPAAARNRGIEASSAEFVAFLDDDVIAPAGWSRALASDLEACHDDIVGTQAHILVPIADPSRPLTDWERNVQGLERARWATADMAFRRAALVDVDGFDERFPRAFREDADLALRLIDSGYRLVQGSRTIVHPVRRAPRSVSVRLQRGNADDPLMRKLHGRRWHDRIGAPRGARRRHMATTAVALSASAALLSRRRRTAAAAAVGWSAMTAALAWSRIAPGPRTRQELLTMTWTSMLLPPAATFWWLQGCARSMQVHREDSPRRLRVADVLEPTGVRHYAEQVR